MSSDLEPGSGWAGSSGLSSGTLSQLQRFIQPLRDRVMGMVARGWVRLVYRDYPMQALQVEVLKDELSDATEHFQPYGFTSVPLEYMDALVHYLGGDRSASIVSVVADRAHRPLTLSEGDVAIYHKSDHPTASAEDAKHRITLTLGKLIIRVDALDIKCGESSLTMNGSEIGLKVGASTLKMTDAGWVADGRDFIFHIVDGAGPSA
jgi:phage baseplate assembly protein V